MARKGPEDIHDELTLELHGDATPGRVASIAAMFAEALDALGEGAAITMIVKNRNVRASVRARDERAATFVSKIASVVENPMRAVQENAALRPVAEALAKGGAQLASLGGRFVRRRHKIAKFDTTFVHAVEAAAVEPVPPRVAYSGSSFIYTPVLRVGRDKEGQPVRARLIYRGSPRDFEIAERDVGVFFDAAKDQGAIYRVTINSMWQAFADGAVASQLHGAVAAKPQRWEPQAGRTLLSDLKGVVTPEDLDRVRSMMDDT